MRKLKSIEHRYVEAETAVGGIEDIVQYITDSHYIVDTSELEKFIYRLNKQEVEMIILKNLGHSQNEIIKIMNLKNKLKYQRIEGAIRLDSFIFNKFRNK